ncbi:hypothetical protein E2986_09221 [Frieseomelitta varia]|uniref:WD repeat-containing protein 79 n=1 Tax=Frieseomelitta varia TaxID=561572 RepID=A0A833RK53_9HYME|nr:hypothetical protein E2986_09221 [Frieseomelitta varia]
MEFYESIETNLEAVTNVSDKTLVDEIVTEKSEENIVEKISEIQTKENLLDTKENEAIKNTEVTYPTNRFYYNWNNSPRLLCEATAEYEPTDLCENFTKGCQWSPDGTCLLVPSEDFRIRIYELPKELYSEKIPPELSSTKLSAALTIKEGGLIYDTCWYPFMNSWEPATCCFLSTSRESPIHLWDAFNGELRATYRAYNQVDEVEAAISIQFVDSAKKVWAGFKNALRMFDMEHPGRQTDTILFKREFPNVTGLLALEHILKTLASLYKDGPLCTFKTESGVTQIEFSPCGTKLFSVVRRNNEFLCWDLRNPGIVLYSLEGRHSDTNQRIQFDIMHNGKEVVSGGTNGDIIIWELPGSTNCENLNVTHEINLSHDCINGISLHKNLPIVAISTGQRLCDTLPQDRYNSVQLWLCS